MARRSKVRFEISDLKGVKLPTDEDIKHILRAADEIYNKILKVNETSINELIEQLKQTNRQVIKIILNMMSESKNIGFISFLTEWEKVEVKKVRVLIRKIIYKIKSE